MILDFSRSFVHMQGPDVPRFDIEARLQIQSPTHEAVYYLCAACKAERTYAQDDPLFTPDNYDFTPIFDGRGEQVLIFRRFLDYNPKAYKTLYRIGEGKIGIWGRPEFALTIPDDAVEISGYDEILAATRANKLLVGQTALTMPHATTTLTYPVKTMNLNQDSSMMQVDTGPVLIPPLDLPSNPGFEQLRLAYVAFNQPTRACFVIEGPTVHFSKKRGLVYRVLAGLLRPFSGLRSHHYADIVTVDAHNTLLAFD